MFFAKFDANGNVLCASALSSGGDDQNGVSADRFGNAFITGDFMSNPFIIGYDTLIPTGGENVFVAKYSCCGGAGNAAITTADTSISQGQNITLTASGGTSYVWSNGATTSAIVVSPTATTQYCVSASDTVGNCPGNACKTITVKTCESIGGIVIPNVFSPNGDGVNDVFSISGLDKCSSYSLKIYNRWGIPIFETAETGFVWDGRTSAGVNAEEGTYFYILTNNTATRKGFVTLLR